MMPHVRIPSHITALYVFAVVNLMALFHITLVEANVLVLDSMNTTKDDLPDMPANFGRPIPSDGIWGHVMYAEPPNACKPIQSPPNGTRKWIALIRRYGCNFDVKVNHAMRAGYIAAIVHNVGSDDLIPMGAGKGGLSSLIPSVFVGEEDGNSLRVYARDNFTVLVDDRTPMNYNLYLLPFAIVVGICFILMLIFMIAKWVRDLRRRKRSRLSAQHLKKLPIKKFKKGDKYETCAICLDEYEDGDKLRVLPCSHTYHQKCVDPWLTKNKRTCPLCKRKVIPGEDDSDSDSDSEEENGNDNPSETTPLLTTQNLNQNRRHRSNTFENSGLPANMRSEIPTQEQSSDSDDQSEQGATSYQSSVEVHDTPHVHRGSQRPRSRSSGRYGAVHPPTGASGTDMNDSDYHSDFPDNLEGSVHNYTALPTGSINSSGFVINTQEEVPDEELGAVGGFDYRPLNMVEDYFTETKESPNRSRAVMATENISDDKDSCEVQGDPGINDEPGMTDTPEEGASTDAKGSDDNLDVKIVSSKTDKRKTGQTDETA